MVIVLAHEMSHQYQWLVRGAVRRSKNREPIMSHGPSFFEFKKKMAEYGIPLKDCYCDIKWFKTQDIMKI